MRARTVFSRLEPGERGVVEDWLDTLVPGADPAQPIDGEWFLWLVRELIAERESYLLFEIDGGPAYVQLVVGREGEVLVEVSSNEVLPTLRRLSEEQVAALDALGWEPPTCGWPEPLDARGFRAPNHWRRWGAPAPAGEVVLLVLRTLDEAFGVTDLGQLWFTYYRESPGRVGPHPLDHPEVADPMDECFGPLARIDRWRADGLDDPRYVEWLVRWGDHASGWFYPTVWEVPDG